MSNWNRDDIMMAHSGGRFKDGLQLHTYRGGVPSVEYPSERTADWRKGLYLSDGARRIDYVFLFDEGASSGATKRDKRRGDRRARVQYFLRNLVDAGLETETEVYDSEGRRMTVVKLHATWEALCREAELLRIRRPLRLKDPYEQEAEESAWKKFWNLRYLNPDDDQVEARDRVFWPFDRDHPERFLIENKDEFFLPIQRSEMVWNIMQRARSDPHEKERRGMEGLLEDGVVDAAYTLHQGDSAPSSPRQRLRAGWATARALFKPQPINRIRNYFGEKVAFYFAFTQFYTHSLLFPSLFGLLAFLYGLLSVATIVKPALDDICNEHGVGGMEMCPICQPPVCEPFKLYKEGCGRSKWQYRLDNEATLTVSILTVLWCALMLKFWRRRQARLAMDWQTYDTHDMSTVIRPDYEERASEQRVDPVTGQWEPHVPRSRRAPWMALSAAVTFLLLLAAAAGLVGLIAARMALYKAFHYTRFAEENVEISRWLVHLFMYILVTVFEKGYHAIVEKLTVLECHKTDRQFYRSLLWKGFVFAEMVDFLPIAYAAWVKGRYVRTPINLDATSETCEPGGCMAEVVELVAVLLLFRLILGNILEFAVPLIKAIAKRSRERKRRKERGRDWPQWLEDYHLDELELDGISKELMEMMIQLSFIVFFVPALTLAPLVCFINNVIEIRVDANNFLRTHKRPTPERLPKLEIWSTFMDTILKVGVLVNAALIAFTSEIVPRLFYKYRVPQSGGTFVGYTNYSMSLLNVSHWPELQEVVDEAKEKLKRTVHSAASNLTSEHAARFVRSTSAGQHEEAWIADMTQCRYFDYRQTEYPYAKNERYWHVISYRLAAFAALAIGFYIVIYLIDRLIKDTPSDIEAKIKRHQYIMTKYLEEQGQSRSGPASVHTPPAGKPRRGTREDTAGRRRGQRNGQGMVNRIYVDDET